MTARPSGYHASTVTDAGVISVLNTDSIGRSSTSVTSANMLDTRKVEKDPVQQSLIQKYKVLVDPIASEIIGHINADIQLAAHASGERTLGDLIAEAQLSDPSVIGPYG